MTDKASEANRKGAFIRLSDRLNKRPLSQCGIRRLQRLKSNILSRWTKEVITPGATIIFTDKPVDPTTQSAPGFQILVAQKDKPSGTTE